MATGMSPFARCCYGGRTINCTYGNSGTNGGANTWLEYVVGLVYEYIVVPCTSQVPPICVLVMKLMMDMLPGTCNAPRSSALAASAGLFVNAALRYSTMASGRIRCHALFLEVRANRAVGAAARDRGVDLQVGTKTTCRRVVYCLDNSY